MSLLQVNKIDKVGGETPISVSNIIDTIKLRPTIERLASESGYTLVNGSFEEGATVTLKTQVVWQQATGKVFAWFQDAVKTVVTGSTPETTGGIGAGAWVDRTENRLRTDINVVQKRFACVADMVADSTLYVGQIVETIGYYNGWAATVTKPKGGNKYEIVASSTGTVDGGSFISLSNGLQAKGLFVDEVFVPQRWGAKADGVNDDTSSIQATVTFLSTSTSGYYSEYTGKDLHFPSGVYALSAAIVVPQNAGITFTGDGKTKSTIWQTVDNTDIFQLSGNNYRGTFKGLRLCGNQGQVGGTAKAIKITSSGNQIYVDDCWISTVGYAIYGNPTSDSNFTNNVIEYVLTPFYLSGSGNSFFNITGNQFYNCGPVGLGASEQRASFEFTNTTNINFSNNRIVADLAMSPQTNGLFIFTSVTDLIFSNNIFYGTVYDGRTAVFVSCTGVKVKNNIFKGARAEILKFTSCADLQVTGNTLPANKAPATNAFSIMYCDACTNVLVKENLYGKSGTYALHIGVTSGASSGLAIKDNIFDGGTGIALYANIYVTGASRVSINGNTFRSAGLNTYDVIVDTTTYFDMNDNNFYQGYYIDAPVAPSAIHSNIGGTYKTYLSAAPIYGNWEVGDKVFYSSPAAGGYIGAVCTVAGTPGTWKGFGSVAA